MSYQIWIYVLSFIFLIGCDNQKALIPLSAPFPPPLEAPHSKLPQGQLGGRLLAPTMGDPKTFNPILAEESSSREILGLVFEGLVNKDQVTQELQPGMAESWQVEPNGKTFTFHLRKDIFWNDGVPFTANDVVFTFKDVIYNPSIPNRISDFLAVDGKPFELEKLDDYTVRFISPEIFAPFLEFVGGQEILPKHKLDEAVKNGTFLKTWGINTSVTNIVGTGPFRIRSYHPGQRTVFERNPYYYQVAPNGQRLPYLDHVVLNIVRDANAMFLNFISGASDIDSLHSPSIRPEESAFAQRFAKKRDFQVIERGPSDYAVFFFFNQNPSKNAETQKQIVTPYKLKWFQDKRFRQAISYSIDRQGIIDANYFGMGVPLWSSETTSNPRWFNPNVRQYTRNLKKAHDLLQEAGFRYRDNGLLEDSEGHLVEFVLNTIQGAQSRVNASSIIQENLKEIGITMKLQMVDFNLLVRKITETYDFEAILIGLGGGSDDPTAAQSFFLSSGRMHYWNPLQKKPATAWEARIDELMNAQLKTLDYPIRKKYYDEVQAIIAEEQPAIYLATPLTYSGIRNEWQNIVKPAGSGRSLVWNLQEIWTSTP